MDDGHDLDLVGLGAVDDPVALNDQFPHIVAVDKYQGHPTFELFDYNALNRLVRDASAALPKITYTYDPNGNRLTAIDGDPQARDAAGNLLSDRNGTRTYEYNAAGRLWKVYENGQLIATYTYNAYGQRVRKDTRAGTILYHYDLQGRLIAETRLDGTPVRDYLHLEDRPIAQIEINATGQETITYLHTDHLGTPRVGTDENGVVVWRWKSDAFGNRPPEEDPDGDGVMTEVNLRFAGQYYDGETGFYYNYFRYYDPETGRYITSDPVGLVGGLNTYGYVNANPINNVDIFGLFGLIFSTSEGVEQTADAVYGVYTYARGLSRLIRQAARRAGLYGRCEKAQAAFEDRILEKLLEFTQKNPDLARKIAELYIQKHPSRVVGRVITGFVVSGRFGTRIGIPTTAGAALGDATTSIEYGVNTIEGLIEAIVGGTIDELDSNGMMCRCK